MDYYKGNIPIIDHTPQALAYAMPTHVDGRRIGYGYVPRDFKADPIEMFDAPSGMTVIPESEWDARYDEEEATKSSLEHLYLQGADTPVFENLDQNGDGYCWAYSTGHAIMLKRLAKGLPLIRLNPHATAAIIKGGRDEGGWCGLSAKWARENGYAEEGTGPGQWPLHSRNLKYDTAELRANMAKHKVTEDWVDMTKDVYDQNLAEAQLATCNFTNDPTPTDYNWWGHSVCRLRKVRIEKGAWGVLILNSWKGWGRHGLAVLRGDKARADSAVAFRSVTISAA
jgi:hypothetical protein